MFGATRHCNLLASGTEQGTGTGLSSRDGVRKRRLHMQNGPIFLSCRGSGLPREGDAKTSLLACLYPTPTGRHSTPRIYITKFEILNHGKQRCIQPTRRDAFYGT